MDIHGHERFHDTGGNGRYVERGIEHADSSNGILVSAQRFAETMLSDVLHKVLHDAIDRLPEIIVCQLRVVKNEVREELKETGGKAIQVAGLFGLGIVFATFAISCLLVAITLGLAMVMPMWGATLLIALGTSIAAGAFIALGRKRFQEMPTTRRPIEKVGKEIAANLAQCADSSQTRPGAPS